MADLKSGTNKKKTEAERARDFTPNINLGLPVLIPEAYVKDLPVRLGLYRRIGSLANEAEVEAMGAELADRFGKLPDEVENLLQVVAIKALCKTAGVEKLDAGPKGIVLSFNRNTPPNAEGLMVWVGAQKGLVKLRPDSKLALLREMDLNQRVRVSKELLGALAKVAVSVNVRAITPPPPPPRPVAKPVPKTLPVAAQRLRQGQAQNCLHPDHFAGQPRLLGQRDRRRPAQLHQPAAGVRHRRQCGAVGVVAQLVVHQRSAAEGAEMPAARLQQRHAQALRHLPVQHLAALCHVAAQLMRRDPAEAGEAHPQRAGPGLAVEAVIGRVLQVALQHHLAELHHLALRAAGQEALHRAAARHLVDVGEQHMVVAADAAFQQRRQHRVALIGFQPEARCLGAIP